MQLPSSQQMLCLTVIQTENWGCRRPERMPPMTTPVVLILTATPHHHIWLRLATCQNSRSTIISLMSPKKKKRGGGGQGQIMMMTKIQHLAHAISTLVTVTEACSNNSFAFDSMVGILFHPTRKSIPETVQPLMKDHPALPLLRLFFLMKKVVLRGWGWGVLTTLMRVLPLLRPIFFLKKWL